MAEDYEYELDLWSLLMKLGKANKRRTGTRLTWVEVQTLFMEFGPDFDDVKSRAFQAMTDKAIKNA